MKKLLSLFAATGLVATTSATVVACGDKVETLTIINGEDNLKKLVKLLSVDKDGDGKIDRDTKAEEWDKDYKIDDVKTTGSIEGETVDEWGFITAYFNETKDLKNDKKKDDSGIQGNTYTTTVVGKKDATKVTVYVNKVNFDVKIQDGKQSGSVTGSVIGKIVITLPVTK
ncbi:hypothetical protein SCHIN_v1c10260 [Spiroplasma chinense]|uniref:Lipoprotein n=1 Tax=Spiroplasma chinense TaxID=216932 RepID=A0A5B9Y694_9MOLU|nr:lipoprotein [Spiroplasma chinense]QEH62219.1 hypothetical protein SCHIN_v1c10260 [Spiroplasma chinense]